jgi:hypothetical protein
MKAEKQTVRFSRKQILLMESTADASCPIAVLFAVWNPPCSDQLRILEAYGLRLKSVAGDVGTADLPVRALQRVASLNFIRYLELALPLSFARNR